MSFMYNVPMVSNRSLSIMTKNLGGSGKESFFPFVLFVLVIKSFTQVRKSLIRKVLFSCCLINIPLV